MQNVLGKGLKTCKTSKIQGYAKKDRFYKQYFKNIDYLCKKI